MADGRHVGKYSKWHNSPTNGPTGTQLGWSHSIMCPTCPLWCGCHGDGRCYWTLCSHGRLEAESVNQFWWNLVCNSTLGPQWQSWDQILKFLKFKMADGRHVGKYSKCHKSPTRDPTWVVTSHHVPDMSTTIWLLWRTRLQMDRLGLNFGGRIPSCSQYWQCYNSSYNGTDWDDSWMVASKQHLCCKTVSLVFGRYC